jgi:uncharacterized repeat protein (TIGR01451 family)
MATFVQFLRLTVLVSALLTTSPGVTQRLSADPETRGIIPTSGIELVKQGTLQADPLMWPIPGDLIDYTFSVSNTGGLTLFSIRIIDPLLGNAIQCPMASLDSNDSMTCTGSYAITQSDIDFGGVSNRATVVAIDAMGFEVTHTDGDFVHIPQFRALHVFKSGQFQDDDGDGIPRPGETIAYTISLTNTGNTTLLDLIPIDTLLPRISCDEGAATIDTLAPRARAVCTGTYSITQADLNAGSVTNTVEVIADDGTVLGNAQAVVSLLQVPGLHLVKEGAYAATKRGYGYAGDVVSYQFLLTNIGNVRLLNPTVLDDKVLGVRCPLVAEMAPADSVTCTGSYTLTQQDVDAGALTNHARAFATMSEDETVEATDSHTLVIPAIYGLSLAKRGVLAHGSIPVPGDEIIYSFGVTNTSNVTVSGVIIEDPLVAQFSCPSGYPIQSLSPQGSEVCSGRYAVTRDDITAGVRVNTATALLVDATGVVLASAEATASVELPRVPHLKMNKIGEFIATENNRIVADYIRYSITVTNDGAIPLPAVTVSDPLIRDLLCEPAVPTELGIDAQLRCSGTYWPTQSDYDAGGVDNQASAVSWDPAGQISAEAQATVRVMLPSNPALSVQRTGALPNEESPGAGDVVNYVNRITNTGNLTLTVTEVMDSQLGSLACGNDNRAVGPTLLPGATLDCPAPYNIVQGDVDNGRIDSSVVAFAGDPQGLTVSAGNEHNLIIRQLPALSLDKTGTLEVLDVNRRIGSGYIIRYTLELANTGNVTLNHVLVSDPDIPHLDCSAGELSVGSTLSCAGSYDVTQADLDSGQKSNTATALATGPTGQQVTGSDTHVEPLPWRPGLVLSKHGVVMVGDNNIADPGEFIDYTLTVHNSGNVTLADISVTDLMLPAIECDTTHPIVTLAPGTVESCYGSVVLTQEQIDLGMMYNEAHAEASDPAGGLTTSDTFDTTEIIGAVIFDNGFEALPTNE